jgi:hypothetical protein
MNTAMFWALSLLAGAPPAFARVAVIDNSGSMQGERIATVRAELRKVIEQLPPSAEHPLILITFGSVVERAKIITAKNEAEQALATLQGNGGGTRIAPALLYASRELQAYAHSPTLLVMLYTDGEDADREGIRRAEEALDKLFHARSEEGLSQSVFLKRWGGANLDLVQRMKARGRADILDAGELAIQPLTFDPSIKIVHAERDTKDSRTLHVTYEPAILVRGDDPSAASLMYQVRCTWEQATGQTSASLETGAGNQPLTLSYPVPAAAEQQGYITIPFEFKVIRPASAARGFVLPLLPASLVQARVPLPPRKVLLRWAASLDQITAQGWVDAQAAIVRCQGVVAIEIDGDTRPDSSPLHITAPPPLRILAPSQPVKIAGATRLPVELAVPLTEAATDAVSTTLPIELALSIEPQDQVTSWQPARLTVQHVGVPAPSRTSTVIAPRIRSTTAPRWVDLVSGVAACEAELDVEIQGPIPDRTALTLIAPPEVERPVLPAGTRLRSGVNHLTLAICARLAPGRKTNFAFTIVPPSATRATEYQVTSGFSVSLLAPPRPVLVNAPQGRLQREIAVSLFDHQERFTLALFPTLQGHHPRGLHGMPGVSVTADKPAEIAAQSGVVGTPLVLGITAPRPAHQPFFRDTQQTIHLKLRPAPASSVVSEGDVTLVIQRQAPLKRLIFYLAWALFPLGVLFALYRIVALLRGAPRLSDHA